MSDTKEQLDREFNALVEKLKASLAEDEKCPLCDNPANYELRDNKNIKLYHCEKCSDFFVSQNAAKRLKKEPHRKPYFSQMASSHQGNELILSITLKVGGVLHPESIPRTSYPQ